MNKQPELHTTNLLMQPLSISFENAALQILRFSKIHENTHAWVIPLHTHPTIELHYILSGAGQIQIDDTLFHVETNDIYVTLPFVPHCQISSAADIMEEYCVECTLELPPAVKGETDPLASLRRFLSRQAFPLPARRMSCCRCCSSLTSRQPFRIRSFCRQSCCICGVCLIFWVYYRRQGCPICFPGKSVQTRRHFVSKATLTSISGRRFPFRICAHSFS